MTLLALIEKSSTIRPRWLPTFQILAWLLALCFALPNRAAALDSRLFPVPDELEPNVHFWTDVYTTYDSHQVLLHDDLHLEIVYAVLDFTELDASGVSAGRRALVRRQEIRQAKSKYRALLENLAAGKTSKSHPEDQARVAKLLAAISGGRGKYSAAAGRLRVQTCLKDQFAEGIERSGVYMTAIEEIFRRRDLPVELSRLPFVESLFQWKARSSAQAGGIWQFVPSTARLYLDMELEFDQRYDPLRASEAAARHLEGNYKALGAWPVAITAYNHGRAGMQRAVRRLGTRDMGQIATRYRSRLFGFASRNFYSEFVAAARIYQDRERYFPGVEPRPALRFDQLNLPLYVPIRELAKSAGAEIETLKEMNPALSSAIWAGHVYLPKNYPLLVPAGQEAAFEAAFKALPEGHKSRHQVGYYYRVRSGDTLSRIASKFGTSTSKLQRANKLRSANRIRVGQRLLIPPGSGGSRATVAGRSTASSVVAQKTPGVHIVRRGETLSGIAETYGSSIAALRSHNGLRSANRIYVGQRLKISSKGSRKTHVVRSGETLHSIARRYGTTVRALKSANKIRSHIIQPSQVLVIP